jgi:signal transduction histidine kinase
VSRWLSGTRALQIGILFLLVVSAAQVLWWYIDQELYGAAVRERTLALFESDRVAAQHALDLGEPAAMIAEDYPHLRVVGGRVEVAPGEREAIEREHERRINRYRWEGGFFLAVLGICMVVLWHALREEGRMRRRQQNFIAAVSHELKSPLASLQLGAETLHLRDLPPERSRAVVERMLGDLRRMGDLVSKILDATRLDHGHIRLRRESVRVARIVDSVLEGFVVAAEQAGVRLESRVPDDVEVLADPLATTTVVRNLVENAVKATAAAGGGSVELRAERTDGHVRLEVRDDGHGFRREESGRLFEKFYRPGDELRRKSPGSGLGLFIVRGFMQLEQGRVDAHSDGPGKGAVFAVSWPVARDAT